MYVKRGSYQPIFDRKGLNIRFPLALSMQNIEREYESAEKSLNGKWGFCQNNVLLKHSSANGI